LGNLYASNNDWLAAQEYYFNAYALDMNNPDFTANLAISLDRLGKYPLAGQYYTQTLALAGATQVSFNVSDIKNRLISIRQFMDQEK
jgi:Flp pilus assembly protein TadD